jgi:DNA-binding XRE family transcriptional regulator
MRKLTLELEPNERVKEELKSMFEIINSFELLEIMKIDWEEGIRVDLMELHLKETQSIDKVKIIGDMEIMSVLKSEGNKHTCLAKYSEPDETKDLFKQFNLNLIYATPIIMSSERYTISVIGDQENLTKFVELAKTYIGKIENMTFKKAAYQRHDILSVLITAQKHGYYRYPRKIKPEELAKKIGISKGTAIEHLRKGEERIMEDIVAGH